VAAFSSTFAAREGGTVARAGERAAAHAEALLARSDEIRSAELAPQRESRELDGVRQATVAAARMVGAGVGREGIMCA
jgi:hypothetical protein